MEHQGVTRTYGEFLNDVNKLSNSLIELGLEKGDVAGCWSANVYEYAVVYYALASIGVINCSLSPFYKSSEMKYALEKGHFKALFIPSTNSIQKPINDYHDVLRQIDFKQLPKLKHLIYIDGEEGESTHPTYDKINITSLNKLMSSNNISTPKRNINPDDVCMLYLTSGTTGKPKLCALGNFGIYNNVRIIYGYKRGDYLDQKSDHFKRRICLPLPFFHAFAGVLGLGYMSYLPVTFVIPGFRYNPSSVLSSIEKHSCSEWWAVPTMLYDLVHYVNSEEGKKFNTSSLKLIGVGADIVPPELTKAAMKSIPSLETVYVGYGATESHGVITYSRREDSLENKTTTVGTAIDFTQIKIIDKLTGQVVKLGEKGELLVRGHNVMKCYWNDPEKTEEAVKSGWYYTGDQATMNSSGFINIVGRTKEMLIRAGVNIFPREVEDVLIEHPDISVAAVCGIPNERLGQEVVAWVKLTNGNESKLTSKDIIDYCKSKIASYKTPSYVFFVDSYPMTASGKVQKYKMTQITLEWLKSGKRS